MHIIFHYSEPEPEPRHRAQAGDVKLVRGRWYVRQQVYSEMDRAWVVRRGSPVFEWVPEEQARDTYRTGWVQPARKKRQSKTTKQDNRR